MTAFDSWNFVLWLSWNCSRSDSFAYPVDGRDLVRTWGNKMGDSLKRGRNQNWNSVGRESNVIVIYHQSVILRVQYDKYCTLVSQSELLYFCVLVIMKITSIDEKLFANPIYVIINY